MNRRSLLTPCGVMIGALVLLAQGGSLSRPQNSKDNFPDAAHRALKIIASGNLDKFIASASEEGVLVVRRQLDWEKSKKNTPLKEPAMPTIPSQKGNTSYGMTFRMGGLTPTFRQEEEVMFEKREMKGKDFRRLFRQFQYFVSESQRSWSGGIRIASNLNGAGYYPRYLGPAAEGKMASNYFWHIYFVQENGAWRVWKLEAEYTH